METTPNARMISCQQCGAPIPYHVGYTPWCDQCGWNMCHDLPETPATAKGVTGLFERLSGKVSSHSAIALFEEQTNGDPQQAPEVNWTRACAYGIAGFVHLVTLAIITFGIWITIRTPLLFVVGILCLLIGWLSRPRLGGIPKDALPRAQFGKVYALVDRVAQAAGAAPVRAIIVRPWFTAAISQVGLRRQNVLVLGLPLVTVLERQEFVALVAHELAHTVNGDPNRHLLLSSAMDVLGNWYRFLDSGLIDVRDPRNVAMGGGLLSLVQYLLKIVSVIPYLLGFILVHLLWHDSQRAEYRADRRAAEISSTDAFVSMLRKLGCDEPYHSIAREAALRWDIEKGDVFSDLRSYIGHIPESEMERVKRVQELRESKFPDPSHPNTERRASVLLMHRSMTAKATCGQAEYEGILQDLHTFEPDMQRMIIRAHLTLGEYYSMQGSI